MRTLNKILYFILTIVAFSAMGVWIPIAIDYFKGDTLGKETWEILPGNILTYYLSIVSVAIVDRIIYIVKDERYRHKITEVLIIAFVIILYIILTYLSFRFVYHKEFNKATNCALIATLFAYGMWWIANWKEQKVDPFNPLGGPLQEK